MVGQLACIALSRDAEVEGAMDRLASSVCIDMVSFVSAFLTAACRGDRGVDGFGFRSRNMSIF